MLNSYDWHLEFKNLDANVSYNKFAGIYNKGLIYFIPTITKGVVKTKAPWMNSYLKKLIRKKRNLWRKCLHNRFLNKGNVLEYKSIRNKVKKEIKNRIKLYETTIALNVKNNPKAIYAYINKKSKVKEGINALNVNSKLETKYLSIAHSLNKYFSSVFTNEISDNMPFFKNRTNIICDDPTFSPDTVYIILKSLNPNKCTGVDGVHPFPLKCCADAFSLPLSLIFNKSYDTGIIPSMWLNANITPLFKSGDKSEPSSYRPVSLTSVISKVMERILKATFMPYLENNNLLTKAQHGFS